MSIFTKGLNDNLKSFITVRIKSIRLQNFPDLVSVNCCFTMTSSLYKFIEFDVMKEDPLLWNFSQGTIKVLEEHSIEFEDLFINLVYLEETDLFIKTILVLSILLGVGDNAILLLGTRDNPLEVLN